MIDLKCQSAVDAFRNNNIDKIHAASKYYFDNEVEKFLEVLSKDIQMVYMSPAYSSWLHIAASDGKIDICSAILDLGVPVDLCNRVHSDWYDTPLVDAALSGQFTTVKFFCEHGASVDGLPRGIRTPLIAASMSNSCESVKYLLSLSPDINRLHSVDNITALDLAKSYGHQEIVDILLMHGAKSAQEIIYSENERAPGVLEFFYDNAGMILSSKFTTTKEKYQIDIRTALIDKGSKWKILFSIGGYHRSPHKEFYLCLPSTWPLNNALLNSNDVWSFPIQLLQKITDYWLEKGIVEEGFTIVRDSDPWQHLPWPKNIDGFIAIDHQDAKNLDVNLAGCEEDIATLFALVPVVFPKNGQFFEKKLQGWIEKKRHLKWPSLALKKEWVE
jgi:hypothetical protein